MQWSRTGPAHDARMAATQRTVDEARRRLRRLLLEIGRELRDVRIGAGLSQAAVARAASLSPAQVSRIERGAMLHVATEDVVRVAAVLGLEPSLRLYPVGDPIRDAAQLSLLERLRSRLHPSLGWRTEVPLPIAGDRRAWDAVVRGPDFIIAVEAETRLHDVQAMQRRVSLKRRDGAVDHVALLIAGTRHNREVLAGSRHALRSDFPLDTRALLRALADGADPGADGVLLL